MSINTVAIYNQITQAIQEYGTNINIYRDIYIKDENDCDNLVESMKYINSIKGIIDNSSENRNDKVNTNRGVIRLNNKPSLYVPYDKNIILKENDYMEIDNIYYRVGTFTDLVHYNLLYQIPLERVELNE